MTLPVILVKWTIQFLCICIFRQYGFHSLKVAVTLKLYVMNLTSLWNELPWIIMYTIAIIFYHAQGYCLL